MSVKRSRQSADLPLDEFYLDLQRDGNILGFGSIEEIRRSPFPGLRPFRTSESTIFFGRDQQNHDLLRLLRTNQFIAITGNSGTGKSSLVRAGLIPNLYAGYLNSASQWNIGICRPGMDPVRHLAVSLASLKCGSAQSSKIIDVLPEIEQSLLENPFAIVEFHKQLSKADTGKSEKNLLIIIDQFEEFFRFDNLNSGSKKDYGSDHFINLLLKSAAANENIYVIVVLRAEFLGECIRFKDLPEAINKGIYLLPRISTSDLISIIKGPLSLVDVQISQVLVNQLINEMGSEFDQLANLQHVLMRTYQKWLEEDNSEQINYDHYESTGGLKKSLSQHAAESYENLDNAELKIVAKIMFQTITSMSTGGVGVRRPCRLEEICDVANSAGATTKEVHEVANHFRKSLFLSPSVHVVLHQDSIIDITHESLIRHWHLLRQWIEEEAESANLYKTLNERREHGPEHLEGNLLENMLRWRKHYPISAAWAKRYHPSLEGQKANLFDRNMAFLEHSYELFKKKRKKRRVVLTGFQLILLLAISLIISSVLRWVIN